MGFHHYAQLCFWAFNRCAGSCSGEVGENHIQASFEKVKKSEHLTEAMTLSQMILSKRGDKKGRFSDSLEASLLFAGAI